MDAAALGCAVLAALLFYNTLDAGFVYDDRRAILSNPDVVGGSSLWRLLLADFWGTPLRHSGSHGSWRPLCVLSFRLNAALGGGWHLLNVGLHAANAALVVRLARRIIPGAVGPPVAGALFAAHPVHCEAVAGLVGRADLAACCFYLLAVISYVGHVRARDGSPQNCTGAGSTFLRDALFCAKSLLPHRNRREERPQGYPQKIRRKYTKHLRKSSDGSTSTDSVSAVYDCNRRSRLPFSDDWFENNNTIILPEYDNVGPDPQIYCYKQGNYESDNEARGTMIDPEKKRVTKPSRTTSGLKLKTGKWYNNNVGENCFVKSERESSHDSKVSQPENMSGDNFGKKKRRVAYASEVCECCVTCKACKKQRVVLPLILCVVCSACALLCKETGITVLAVCALYDLLLLAARGDARRFLTKQRRGRHVLASLLVLGASLGVLLALRVAVAGLRTPVFARADNPAAHAPHLLTRTLTFAYLPVLNFGLLLWPRWLSFDWSMDAVPLVTSLLDPRATVALLFFAALYAVVCRGLTHASCRPAETENTSPRDGRRTRRSLPQTWCPVCRQAAHSVVCRNSNNNNSIPMNGVMCRCLPRRRTHATPRPLLLCIALLAVPFLPATNLFFYVGFVVAERVLYIPSLGYCLLLGLGCQGLAERAAGRGGVSLAVVVALSITLLAFGARTLQRNRDWHDEESLYRSGVDVNPPKSYGNLGSVLSTLGRHEEAEWAFRQALRHRPNMADVHFNLGNLLKTRGQMEEAIKSYHMAIKYRPSLAVAYLGLGQLLESLGRCDEAASMYLRCSELSGEGLKDPDAHAIARLSALLRLAGLLELQGRRGDAAAAYSLALQREAELIHRSQAVQEQLVHIRTKLKALEISQVNHNTEIHIPAGISCTTQTIY